MVGNLIGYGVIFMALVGFKVRLFTGELDNGKLGDNVDDGGVEENMIHAKSISKHR